MDVSAEPPNPGPGQTATLTITASAANGIDKYGIRDVQITLAITTSPDTDAKLDPANVTTDSSGAATTKFTPSRTKGKNVVTATAGTLTTGFDIDTLLGSAGTPTRGRHSGNLDPAGPAGLQFNAALLFAAAALMVGIGFAIPYRQRLLEVGRGLLAGPGQRGKPSAAPVNLAAATGILSPTPSSLRKSRARRKSATRGG